MATTQTKKPTPQTASANSRIAANVADKAAKSAFNAAKTTRDTAENVVKIGGDAVREIYNTSAAGAETAKNTMYQMSREGTAKIAQGADSVTRAMVDALGSARENMETCIECCNIGANLAKEVSTELSESCNQYFSDMVELSKDAFACRTVSDMMELQNRALRSTMDCFFNQSAKISNLCFEYATSALEPINERVVQATQQFGRSMAA